MGLDIWAANNLAPVTEEHYEDEGGVHICKGDWEYQFGDLKEGYYSCDYSDFSFRRSYGRWSHVRERLAELAGWPEWKGQLKDSWYRNFPRQALPTHSEEVNEWDDLPLLPLIYFSDCEGYICTKVCQQIAEDLNKLDIDEELEDLKNLFVWAAENNGIVQFG